MNRESSYFKRASLMLKALPYVAEETCFALKGGTAINFFYRNMPRLSVDIDLTYVPLEPRDPSLKRIQEALIRIAARLERAGFRVQPSRSRDGRTTKLVVADRHGQIKIEPNEVIRGAISAPVERGTAEAVEREFEISATMSVLPLADLYGGKLCAAFDRQHPRDLFDLKVLFESEGITEEIRRAFVVYLASHDRPIHELIEPKRKDIRETFDREFVGMTIFPVELDDLVAARERAIQEISQGLTAAERRFLVSLKEGNPEWPLLGYPDLDKLPSVQWKLANIRRMDKRKHAQALKALRERLGV